jgi:hypothetical protein
MKHITRTALAAALVCAGFSSRANIVLNYSSTANSEISFTSSGFSFINTVSSSNPALLITGVTGTPAPTGNSIGDLGSITGGPFVITSINGAGTQGTVSGSGTLTISDGGGHNLTGSVSWSTIGQMGSGNVLNLNGIINLSSINYTGSQSDLLALASVTVGVESVSFAFAGSMPSLAQLQAGGIVDSFSGQISSVSPVPEAATLIAGLLLLLPMGLSALQRLRRHPTLTVA